MAKCPFNKYKECQESDSRYCYCTLPFDVYNNYKNKSIEKSTNIQKSNIMEKNYRDKLEKKIDFLTNILTEEQLDLYIKWCEENGI